MESTTTTPIVDKDELLMLLKAHSKDFRCGAYLYNLEGVERQQLYHKLETERLEAKYQEVRKMHNETRLNWNHIFLVKFMDALSTMANRANFIEIAMRIGIKNILRERGSRLNLETLFIATSGLLKMLPQDSFTERVEHDGAFLLHKYNITPLKARQWSRMKRSQSSEPIIRLSQAANLFHTYESPITQLVNCKSRDDIFDMFNLEASMEWGKYFGNVRRHIGIDKCDLIGINCVVPILYAYGHFTADDSMIETAGRINEMIPAEHNAIIAKWRNQGLNPIVTYEAQALLQLYKIYCSTKRCEECVVYKHMCSTRNILHKIPRFLEHQR